MTALRTLPMTTLTGILTFILALCVGTLPVTARAQSSLQDQSRQARMQREQLQAAIQALHKDITATENARQEVVLQLRTSEQAISRQTRRLAELNARQRQLTREMTELERKIATHKQTLLARQQALGKQLNVRYMKNTAAGTATFWSVLLSGEPQEMGRELAYLRYVSQAQADALSSVQQGLETLAAMQADLRTRQQTQAALLAQAEKQKKDLQRQYHEREQVLLRINAQLRTQRDGLDNLKRDEQRLNTLVQGLEQALIQQAAVADATDAIQNGLKKGVPYPVNGQVQGRFGAQRPDGGVWRGIVLLAEEGEPVRAIAPGKVVYANWLKGFGNMMIVDHGQDWMSIYAYNQSLLKSVGDAVTAGQTLATVGATGGQVQAGLYFEIRQKGVPVNPLLWLRR